MMSATAIFSLCAMPKPVPASSAARTALDAGTGFGIAQSEKIAVADIMAVREMAPQLGQLTKQILRHVPELKRLRISSIDQIEVDRDLLDVIADDERLMPHLHLSLQSGDDLILKRMKRRHCRADAVQFCAQVRRL